MAKWQSAQNRAWEDTESFRKNSKWWFWGVEIVGGALFGAIGSLIGGYYTPSNASVFWQNGYPTIGGFTGVIAGFIIAFLFLLFWNLFRAPYKQRNESRALLTKGIGLTVPTPSISVKTMVNYLIEPNVLRFKWSAIDNEKEWLKRGGSPDGMPKFIRFNVPKIPDIVKSEDCPKAITISKSLWGSLRRESTPYVIVHAFDSKKGVQIEGYGIPLFEVDVYEDPNPPASHKEGSQN